MSQAIDASTDESKQLSAVAPVSLPPVCSMYYELLMSTRFNLDELSQCPACKVQVAFHHHQPPSQAAVADVSANVSSAKYESDSSAYALHFTSGVRSILPKWRIDYKYVKPFLDRCEQVLTADNVDPKVWVRLLLRAVEDVGESSWVQSNIVDKKLSWQEAREAFAKHFELFSYSTQIVQDYECIKQSSRQTVQDYSHKFMRLCAELGYESTNPLVVQHYINGLSPERLASYKKQLALVKLIRGDDSYTVASLETAVQLTLDLELVDVNSQIRNLTLPGETKTGAGGQPQGNNKKNAKVCANHPHSSSHTTAECSWNKSGNNHYGGAGTGGTNNQRSNSGGNSTSPRENQRNTNTHGGGYKKPIKCYLCGGPHLANDPACPKRSSVSTRSGSNTAATPSVTFANPISTSGSKIARSSLSRTVDIVARTDIGDESATVAASESAAAAVIDRTLSETAVIPQYKGVMLVLKDQVYNTLVDTGATISFIDETLVKELHLPIELASDDKTRINMAHTGLSAPRIGRTHIDRLVALFPFSTRKTIDFSHMFEVLPINDKLNDYHFVIGTDLIPALFPDGIPLCYVPRSGDTTSTPSINVRIAGIIDSDRESSADIGYDELPIQEQPNRPVAYTPAELENQYAGKRNALLQQLAEPLAVNERITGFCNIPETIVHLRIDPALENSLYTKQYPIAHALYDPADKVIMRWLNTGKICFAPPGCRYNNPLTIAPKKDENGVWTGIRVCLDVRRLNKALIVGDKFPIPHIRNVLESFAGNSVFGEFDLSEAYLQFQLHPDSQPLTAFTWRGQQYMFVGCPYGITLLTSYFQRLMMRIFNDMPFCMPYVDNLPFASKSWEEHRTHALCIIERLTQVNLRLKQSWHIGHAQLRCLGHILNINGTAMDPDKMQAVMDWPLPSTPADLQSFLGLCSFVRSHIRHYAEITGPLEEIKNQKELIWDDNLRHHFETVKEALSRAPILSFPDYDRPFHIATDASNTGIGGVLFQPKSEAEHITPDNIVAICSKKLNPRQRDWSAYKKELWGIVYALRKFHSYIWGRTDLVIHTDHKPLIYMFSSSLLSPALQQWLDTILDYSFDIRHRDGILNVIPDQLSRMFGAVYSNIPVWGATDLAKHISYPLPLQESLRGGSLGDRGEAADSASDSIHSDSIPDIDQSILEVELERRGKRCPATEAERIELIQQHHQFGHFGREAIFKQLWNKGYWWPCIRKEIETELKSCDPCTRFVVVKSGFHPSQCITASGPGEHLQIDTSVHLPESPDGYTALLVCIDVFTGFVMLRPLRNTTAEVVARKLWKIFCTIGFPRILQSDNGSEFVNDTLRALIKITGIDHRFISAYNPRTDGKVERSIGTCMGIIKKLLHGTNKLWPLFVSFAQITFNNKITELTGSSPFALMFGRELNELKDYSGDNATVIPLDDWKAHQEKIVTLIYPAIHERIKSGKRKMMQTLDKNRRLISPNAFPAGSTVMLIDPDRDNKFEPKYIGPYTIVRRSRGGAYVLKDATGDLLDRRVPADQLKLLAKVSKRKIDVEKPIFEIQKIVEHRGEPGHYEYQVQWKGYREDERTWEPQHSFMDHSVIEKYWKARKQAPNTTN